MESDDVNRERKITMVIVFDTYGTLDQAEKTKERIRKELALQGFRFTVLSVGHG